MTASGQPIEGLRRDLEERAVDETLSRKDLELTQALEQLIEIIRRPHEATRELIR